MELKIIKTKRLLLRPLSNTDSKILFPLFSKRSIEDYCYCTDTMEDMDRWIQDSLDNKYTPWVMIYNEQPIGIVDICWNYDESCMEVGYMVDIGYQKQGFATEGLYAGIKWYIDNLNKSKFMAGITIHNNASRNLVEKLGFELSRTVKQDWEWRGVTYDSVYYFLDGHDLKIKT